MGLVTLNFDLLTLKLVCWSHVCWAISLPILVFLALLVLELFTMYATDRRTDGRTKATHNAPYPTGGGIIKNTQSHNNKSLANMYQLRHLLSLTEQNGSILYQIVTAAIKADSRRDITCQMSMWHLCIIILFVVSLIAAILLSLLMY